MVVTRNLASGGTEDVAVSRQYASTDQLQIVAFNTSVFDGTIRVVPRATWDEFTPIPCGAIPRLLRCYLGMANTCNSSLYKDLLEFQAEYYLMSESRGSNNPTNPTGLGDNGTVGQINWGTSPRPPTNDGAR